MNVEELANNYYENLGSNGDFTSVSMADDLRFTGPLHDYIDGERYRTDCAALAAAAKSVSIRHQFVDNESVHTVYDFDLGLPSGPIASSEMLTFAGGVLVAADLIIDSTPLRPKVDA